MHNRLAYIYRIRKRRKRVCRIIRWQYAKNSASFEAKNTGDVDTINEKEFKKKVLEVYKKALNYIDIVNEKAL